ncbi:DUF4878 domain-containing protein [Paenibacillus polymyxa]|uniref:DUF4878 domain-containing protein n=1 Tax=Paenibacillus polymyxa TaxID=1406 RepID=UPI0003FE2EC6|nr:DUF4878 domain-containing protein [Paenibacillus polymyxa]KAF6636905.1 DUF4878 domain-containing protein [Paenibacillus sp. EKM208P]
MKKGSKFFALLISSLLLVIAPLSVTAASVQSEEESAKQAVVNYIDAINNKDADELAKWVDDSRFTSPDEQKKQYKELFQNDEFSSYSIGDFKQDGKEYDVTIDLTRKDSGEVNTVTLPVVKYGDQWKLVVVGEETKSEQVKLQIQKDRGENDKIELDKNKIIKPQASAIANWDFSLTKNDGGLYTRTTAYSSSSFNMTGNSLTMNGWQELPGTTSGVSLVYQIVKKGFVNDDVYGEQILSGRYRENGSWYSFSLSKSGLAPQTGLYIKISNPSAERGAMGAGNAYQ